MTSLVATDLAVDRELASISESFRFLVDVTPVNVDQARKLFLASSDSDPVFQYRDVEDFPEVIRARLDAIDIESVVDPTLARMFSAKSRELHLQLDMLSARGTAEFLDLSVDLYGAVSPALEYQAEEILREVPKAPRSRRRCLDADGIAALATREIARYREQYPELAAPIEIRDDISGVMVANGSLLISSTATVSGSRAEGLLAHEVGTHILTYVNGSLQDLKLMGSGLAGYEETQEGLALLAEAAVGGLTAARLRQMAARVIAVALLVRGCSFGQAHRQLTERYGYSKGGAFTIVMRVWRSGGLTKDAIYLRGLQDLVEYLAAGNEIEDLWQGKMSLVDLPLTSMLTDQGILRAPVIFPSFLSDRTARERLKKVASNAGLHHLIGADT
ncbi:MAG TPA: tyrosine/phenylalanine carboxypeptidase domain-containing protein [Acidimicrobiia bacterium]|nr:tyrosine/phenylalanine carboxypeptidase domain-containing protein [Acidimicrobiia bacterium]